MRLGNGAIENGIGLDGFQQGRQILSNLGGGERVFGFVRFGGLPAEIDQASWIWPSAFCSR